MMPSRSRCVLLSLCILSILVSCPEAKILRQTQTRTQTLTQANNIDQTTTQEPPLPKLIDTSLTSDDPVKYSVKLPKVASDFIILTTGDQIKLYPLASSQEGGSEPILNQNFWYQVKPIENFEELWAGKNELLSVLDNSTYTSWLVAKLAAEAIDRVSGKRKKSILPNGSAEDEESYLGTGWLKPKVTDVDYFFDREFCRHEHFSRATINSDDGFGDRPLRDNDCLVVVWLDKNNMYVRYGSVNLVTNPIELFEIGSKRKAREDKVLLLHEFVPINIRKEIFDKHLAPNLYPLKQTATLQVHGLVVDKRRSKLHLAFGFNSNNISNWILSGSIAPIYRVDQVYDGMTQLMDETVFSFNACHKILCKNMNETSIENLHVDEETGDWLFYFDRYQGGKIYALNLKRRELHLLESSNSDIITTSVQRGSAYTIPHALVVDIPMASNQANSILSAKVATGMAMDLSSRRFYWLNKANELYSCNLTGGDITLMGKLAPKPLIRSIYSMQVSQNTLYISNPMKKSLIAYKLSSKDQQVSDANNANQDENLLTSATVPANHLQKNTHQVLLVEMPTLYGFRVVHIRQEYMSTTSNEHSAGESSYISRAKIEEESTTGPSDEEDENLNERNLFAGEDKTWLDFKTYMDIAKVSRKSTQQDRVEHRELLKRAESSLDCGYEHQQSQTIFTNDTFSCSEIAILAIQLAVLIALLITAIYYLWLALNLSSKVSLLDQAYDDAEKGNIA